MKWVQSKNSFLKSKLSELIADSILNEDNNLGFCSDGQLARRESIWT